MAVTLNEFETSSETTVFNEEQDNARREQYLERRSLVLQFLQSNLSPQHLQHHHSKIELMKKCTFYLEVEPKHWNVRNQNNEMYRADILQVLDLCQFGKMKKVAKTQLEIQLTLLTELLEQLQQGQLELRRYTETWDMVTFLSRWDFITQRLAKLSEFMAKLLSLEVPGGLYVKHYLVSHADLRGIRGPDIKLTISMKAPVIFDRRQSLADSYWARLVWFSGNEETPEQYELLLLEANALREDRHNRVWVVSSNMCLVLDLQPGITYRFKIRRPHTDFLICSPWQDTITLTTRSNAIEGVGKSTCTLACGDM
ncbi:fibronectin type III domain-containing protein 11 [Porphyrio hochstetteri]